MPRERRATVEDVRKQYLRGSTTVDQDAAEVIRKEVGRFLSCVAEGMPDICVFFRIS
jgi:hypothetical protein